MATKNTLEDLMFAHQYLDYVSRRVKDPEKRARAKILLAMIQMLDLRHPSWRAELIVELDRLNLSRRVEDLFPLPKVDDGKLFSEFMKTVVGEEKNDDDAA